MLSSFDNFFKFSQWANLSKLCKLKRSFFNQNKEEKNFILFFFFINIFYINIFYII